MIKTVWVGTIAFQGADAEIEAMQRRTFGKGCHKNACADACTFSDRLRNPLVSVGLCAVRAKP